ncbi:MAG: hypothetical protein ACI8ZM_001976 [Crocinitomix sp.]|jgi:hypothetical protein
MKKFLYILSILIAVVLLDSCTKEDVFRCDGDHDPFGVENFDDEDSDSRGALDENGGGGIVDDDEDDDDDEDGDVIVDDDEDDDDDEQDDNEQLDDRVGDDDED